MRIVQAHHFYRSTVPSGENRVVERERDLLRKEGFDVITMWRHSDAILKGGLLSKVSLATGLHARSSRVRELSSILGLVQADLLHAHNVWPSFTYGLFEAAQAAGLRTVQTLHNYRLIAGNDHFFGPNGARRPRSRSEREHLRRMPAMHGRLANRLYTRALSRYWREGVPQRKVDAYICLSQFQKSVMVEAGLPAEKMVIKPNFLAHDGPIGDAPGEFALFVGRLSADKGVRQLARWWPRTGLPLKIVGDGPLKKQLPCDRRIEFLGPLPQADVQQLMSRARFLVMTSTWYEGQPLVVIEAFASGLPCLLPRLGSLTELVENGRTGALYEGERSDDFVRQAQAMWETAPRMRERCRTQYEQCYTPEVNARWLSRIYANVIAGRRADDGLVAAPAADGVVSEWLTHADVS